VEDTGSMLARRLAAAAALLFALASIVTGLVATITSFPRGLFALLLLALALIAVWHAVLRRGMQRWVSAAVGVAALIGAGALLVSGHPIETAIFVVTAIASLALARTAFVVHVHLPRTSAPTRAVLIYNPKSGGGKATRFKLAEEARRRGIEPIELTRDTTLEAIVEDALARGADGLAMAGGDGSQAVVAAAAAKAGVPYACIPAGTRNHFALDLGVDRNDVVGALEAFVDGGERWVDLAEVNGRVFVNNVSLGVYADAVQHEGYRDAKIRTLLETIPEVAAPDGDAPPLAWRDPDGETHTGGLALLVSNNPYRLGRAMASGTRPHLDTGTLGVAILGPAGGIRRGLLRMWRLPWIEVDAREPVPAGIDGEAALLQPPIRFESRPAALRVRIADKHPGASPSAGLPESPWESVGALAQIALRGAPQSQARLEPASGQVQAEAKEGG
jgi:diacylglycerol kinase family enzyme